MVLDKLKNIIDNELGQSETFVYPESNQIKRDISDLREIRIRSAKVPMS